MKYILVISLLCLNSIIYAQKKQLPEQSFPPTVKYYLWEKDGGPQYAFLKFDNKRDYYIFNKTCKPSSLSKGEITTIENLISKKVKEFNSITKGRRIEQSTKYYKQFIPVINSKGEKEVWVNCACEILQNEWKKEPQMVNDGGSCFFHLKINLAKKLVYDFRVNGVA